MHPRARDTQPTPLLSSATAGPAAPTDPREAEERGSDSDSGSPSRQKSGLLPEVHSGQGQSLQVQRGRAQGSPPSQFHPQRQSLGCVPLTGTRCPMARGTGATHTHTGSAAPGAGGAGAVGSTVSPRRALVLRSCRTRLLCSSHPARMGTVTEARPGPGRRHGAAVQEACDSPELAAPQIPAGCARATLSAPSPASESCHQHSATSAGSSRTSPCLVPHGNPEAV